MQIDVFAGKQQSKWLCDSCIPHFNRKYIDPFKI